MRVYTSRYGSADDALMKVDYSDRLRKMVQAGESMSRRTQEEWHDYFGEKLSEMSEKVRASMRDIERIWVAYTLQALYDAELNMQISAMQIGTFTDASDAGWWVWNLGDKVNGWETGGRASTLVDAVEGLALEAARMYPVFKPLARPR